MPTGDQTPLTPEQSALAAELYAAVAPAILNRWARRWPGVRDLVLSGLGLGVTLAARDWKPDCGLTLQAYASYRATMQIRSDIGHEVRSLARLQFLPALAPDMENGTRTDRPGPEPGPTWDRLVGLLSPAERSAVEAYYGHGLGAAAAARSMGTTLTTADARRRAALDRLRGRLTEALTCSSSDGAKANGSSSGPTENRSGSRSPKSTFGTTA